MKNDLIALLLYLLLFGIIGILSIISYFNNVAIIDLGISAKTMDLIIMILSILGIAKTVFHIHRF